MLLDRLASISAEFSRAKRQLISLPVTQVVM
jgi:hypothetical protein